MTPAIDIFGVTISEPTTTLTDYMITVAAAWFAIRLWTAAVRNRPRQFWGLAFLFIGIGALLGGTSHGFVDYLDEWALHLIWKGTVYCVGFSMLFAVAGTVGSGLPAGVARIALQALNILAFLAYSAWMLNHSAFVYVINFYVPAMTSIALLQSWAYYRHRSSSAPWIIAGVIVTLLGAVIQQSGFTLHRHFNNNDLYHVVQIAGLYLLYRGASRVRDQSGSIE
jgi:hypothetical protein